MNNVLKLLNHKPIAYYPIYRQITGSTTAGVVLSQLIYWFLKKDEIYKTDNEIRKETYLTIDEFRSAKKKIKNLDFIAITKRGIPAKTYYKIDWDLYQTCLGKIPKQDDSKIHNKVEGKTLNSDGEKAQTIIEIKDRDYTKTTTETKKSIKKELDFKLLIDELQTKAPRKSLVKYSTQAKETFLKIDKSWETIKNNYLLHQNKEQKFSKKFENFLLDYDACVSDLIETTKAKTTTNHSKTQSAIDRVFAQNALNETTQIEFFDVEVMQR